jgi:hypothetical protein
VSLSEEEVLARCDELRRFVLGDLERLVKMPVGGNFAVAGLVAASCEALACLRGERQGQGWKVLAEILPAPFSDVAMSLWKAMRNGLMHNYWPNTLRIDDTDIYLSFSWREKEHLSWSDGGELVLLVPALVDGLADAWAQFARQLEHDHAAQSAAKKDLEKLGRIDTVKDEREKAAWLHILSGRRPLAKG